MTAPATPPGLEERLREIASTLGQRQAEFVEHNCAIPADHQALDAAECMTQAADALAKARVALEKIASLQAEKPNPHNVTLFDALDVAEAIGRWTAAEIARIAIAQLDGAALEAMVK